MELVDRRNGETSAERDHIVRLLRHWVGEIGDSPWPGIEPTHRALLEHLASVFDPRDPP